MRIHVLLLLAPSVLAPAAIGQTKTSASASAGSAPTVFIEADGVKYAYRRLGPKTGVPVVFLQHFTGTMDYWDPAVVNGFAVARPVILFDNAGVGRSGGTTPDTVEGMASHAVKFLRALGLTQVDLLGFSLGGFVAQVVAAEEPRLVRRVILVGTGPKGGEGIADVGRELEQAQKRSPQQPRLYLFFDETETSQAAGRAFIERQAKRTVDRDPDATEATVGAQFKAIVGWGKGDTTRSASRLRRIAQPVLIVNGKHDVMVPASNSVAMFNQLPNARLLLFPDSGHGSLFQFHDDFVREGLEFLAD